MTSNRNLMCNKSAVVVLHEQDSDSIILTKRSQHLRTHPGEICLPGGGWESCDKDLWTTALRELEEELGIQADRVHRIEALSPERTHAKTVIYPWLATITKLQPFLMNENEVSAVIALPVREVTCQENYQDIIVSKYGKVIQSCQFIASQHFVWGATARIMKQLCEIKTLIK